MVSDEKDDDMIYALTADEREELQAGLQGLPETMPPRIVWDRIREQAEAEGLLKQPVSQQKSWWYAGSGLAAAVALAAILVLPYSPQDPAGTPQTIPSVADNMQTQTDTLQALMVESRQLEDNLRALPAGPKVMRAGTAATIAEIESRIAAIDDQLNDPATNLTTDEEKIFWRERVRLMKSLVGLRYAQAQRTAF